MSRLFVPLGLPQNATKLVGRTSQFIVSPSAQILAASSTKTDVILSPGSRYESITLNTDSEPWLLHKSVLFAQSASDTPSQTVAAAPGGLYRVDVGFGQQLVCEPGKVMGTLGPINARIVFAESRFDVLKLWIQLGWARTAATLRGFGASVQNLAQKVNWSKLPKPKWKPSLPSSLKSVQSREAARKVRETASKLKAYTVKASGWTASKLFYWTHPKKLLIEGPTSVLLKP